MKIIIDNSYIEHWSDNLVDLFTKSDYKTYQSVDKKLQSENSDIFHAVLEIHKLKMNECSKKACPWSPPLAAEIHQWQVLDTNNCFKQELKH